MWQSHYEKTFSGPTKDRIWKAWCDIDNWHQWDEDIEYVKVTEPFAEGSHFVLKPKGGPKVTIRLTKVESERGFTGVAKFPLARICDIHEMEETPHGLKLTSIIRVEGPLA